MCKEIDNIQQMKLIINVSAGYPGTKEWVQYAATPFPDVHLVAGNTGVQASQMYPYIPNQLPGMLGAIKGAAEYEELVVDKYDRQRNRTPPARYQGAAEYEELVVDKYDRQQERTPPPRYQEAKRRMGPQLVAHLLMIVLIICGNVVYFMGRRQQRTA
jgi:hypothetical protein